MVGMGDLEYREAGVNLLGFRSTPPARFFQIPRQRGRVFEIEIEEITGTRANPRCGGVSSAVRRPRAGYCLLGPLSALVRLKLKWPPRPDHHDLETNQRARPAEILELVTQFGSGHAGARY